MPVRLEYSTKETSANWFHQIIYGRTGSQRMKYSSAQRWKESIKHHDSPLTTMGKAPCSNARYLPIQTNSLLRYCMWQETMWISTSWSEESSKKTPFWGQKLICTIGRWKMQKQPTGEEQSKKKNNFLQEHQKLNRRNEESPKKIQNFSSYHTTWWLQISLQLQHKTLHTEGYVEEHFNTPQVPPMVTTPVSCFRSYSTSNLTSFWK